MLRLSHTRGYRLARPSTTSTNLKWSAEPSAPCRAAVSPDGELEEIDDGGGVRLLRRFPSLLGYARNFLVSDRDLVQFIWIDPGGAWFRMKIASLGSNGERRALLSATPSTPPFGLTRRELDVLTLIAGGLGNQGIADALDAKLRTITTHVERILEKTGRASRAGLAGMAAELGLMRLPLPGGRAAISLLGLGEIDGPIRSPNERQRFSRSLAPRPIRIGAPLSLSTFASSDAQEMRNGAALAVEEINQRGGVAGRPLELLVVDCDISNPTAVEAAYKLLIDEEVDAITSGYTCAEERLQDLVADYGAPYLHCVTMEAMVERVRQDPTRLRNVFQTGPSDIHYGPEFMRFAISLEKRKQWRPRNRRAVVIQPSWSKMDIGLEAANALADRNGWTLELIDGLPLNGIDWGAVMNRIHDCDPSAILLAYYFPEETMAFQRSFIGNPLDALVHCLYAPSIPAFQETLQNEAIGVLWSTSTGTYSDQFARGFAERYATMHGRSPGRSHAGLSYDRVNILATAWARAGNPRSFGKVVGELRNTVHRGVNGSYSLDNPGQCGLSYPYTCPDPSLSQAHLVFQVQAATGNVILGPAPYADGLFQLPPWFSDRG
jgi:branched-chain amino acid transport system substrate-binding protein